MALAQHPDITQARQTGAAAHFKSDFAGTSCERRWTLLMCRQSTRHGHALAQACFPRVSCFMECSLISSPSRPYKPKPHLHPNPHPSTSKQPCHTRSTNALAGEWHSDPRLQALGQRIVLQAHDKPTTPEGEQETEGIQYKAWRIEQGVAEGDTEMPSGIKFNSPIHHKGQFSP